MGKKNSKAEGKTVLTTTEWNALQTSGVSFKVKVEANEGIWVVGSLEEIMKKTTVMDNINSTYVDNETPGINFGAVSSDTNGKGVYTRAGTENEEYPIMYYRGNVLDNNVMLGNHCWKAVRTTDTGGVKLVYNGKYSGVKVPFAESDYNIITNTGGMVFDSTDNAWVFNSKTDFGDSETPLEISFSVPSGEDYILEIFGNSGRKITIDIYKGTSGTYELKSGSNVLGYGMELGIKQGFRIMSSNDSIKVTYYGNGTDELEVALKIRVIHPDESLGLACDSIAPMSRISLDGVDSFQYNLSETSPAYVGYMYGDVYNVNSGNTPTGTYYGTGFEWDGTYYTLTNPTTTRDANHHYTCNQTTSDGKCTTIRYYYYVNGSSYIYYVNLENGISVEEALARMQMNVHDSNIKEIIDTWYERNMIEFTNKLEDTIWCNDRSVNDNNGWNPTEGNLIKPILYGAAQRSNYYDTVEKNHPSLLCTNKNDRFTVNNTNGNGTLTYPVALLTADETILGGGLIYSNTDDIYLNNLNTTWTMSPWHFYRGESGAYIGYNSWVWVTQTGLGICPSISLKPSQLITKGTGTVLDPYVIE